MAAAVLSAVQGLVVGTSATHTAVPVGLLAVVRVVVDVDKRVVWPESRLFDLIWVQTVVSH